MAVTAFRASGARVVGVPVDAEGVSIDDLERLADTVPKLRAVSVMPHHPHPTTVTHGADRRIRLLDLVRRRGLTIIEDDYHPAHRSDGKPVLPLASRTGDVPMVSVGSLSKVLAPRIRLGYATGPADLLGRMAADRQAIDRQGDLPLEHAAALLQREGDRGRYGRRTRRILSGAAGSAGGPAAGRNGRSADLRRPGRRAGARGTGVPARLREARRR